MGCPAASREAIYRPRRPRASPLWRLLDRYFDEFQRVYDERYQKRYGFWRPVIARTVEKFLVCGDLHEGFARVRCPKCRYEFLVAFSCRRRCLCPSCHQKRALITADHIAGTLCAPVAHRQFVFTIPKRLRIFFRFDRRLLGELAFAPDGTFIPLPELDREPFEKLWQRKVFDLLLKRGKID